MKEVIALKKVYMANPFYMKPVEIIIPFHATQAKVANLLAAVFRTVATNRYMVTLVDDGSPNGYFSSQIGEKKIDGVRVIRNESQSGFGASVNAALRNPPKQEIPFVCVMHSDVSLETTSWLINLGKSLLEMKESGVKMVCPLTDRPMVDNPQLLYDPNSQQKDSELVSGYIPMYCFLANRALFDKVGPLREVPYAGVEAEDYARRMRAKGYKQGVCGTSWVGHEGRGTLSLYQNDQKVQEILRKAREDYESEIGA